MFTMLQRSAGADRDKIAESEAIDRPCYEKRAGSAEAATKMSRRLYDFWVYAAIFVDLPNSL